MTSDAVAQALRLQDEKPEWRGLPLRLYIEGKGCDGFTYGVSFDPPTADDHHYPQVKGGRVIDLAVDQQTLIYVEGATIQWMDGADGKGFLVENPRHKRFRGKFYKARAWQERLLAGQNTLSAAGQTPIDLRSDHKSTPLVDNSLPQ